MENQKKKPLNRPSKIPIHKLHKIYTPSERSYKEQYPELREIPEFFNIGDAELKFCWYVGCSCSPLIEDGIEEPNRWYLAAKIALKNKQGTQEKFAQGEFPKDGSIEKAIKRMSKFLPSHRIEAKIMAEETFRNIKRAMAYPGTNVQSTQTKKMWVETVIKCLAALPSIVRLLEEGFGNHDDIQEILKKKKKEVITPEDLQHTELVKKIESDESDEITEMVESEDQPEDNE